MPLRAHTSVRIRRHGLRMAIASLTATALLAAPGTAWATPAPVPLTVISEGASTELRSISGSIFFDEVTTPQQRAAVTVTAWRTSGSNREVSASSISYDPSSGAFSLIDLAPGAYDIYAQLSGPTFWFNASTSRLTGWDRGTGQDIFTVVADVTAGDQAGLALHFDQARAGLEVGILNPRSAEEHPVPGDARVIVTEAATGRTSTLAPSTYSADASYSFGGFAPGTVVTVSATLGKVTAFYDGTAVGTADSTKAVPVVIPAAWTSRTLTIDVGTLLARPSTLTTTAPKISGTAKVGAKLSVSPGAWGPSPVTLAYQWKADGAAIAGEMGSSLTVPASVKGKRITVTVSGSKTGYAAAAKTSAATAPVAAGTLTASMPTVAGTAKVGVKLTAKPGTWTAGAKLTYRWYAGGKAIAKATGSTFIPTAAHKGKKVSVTVTGTLPGYTTVTQSSKATSSVGAGTLTAPTPTIAGTVKVGSKLTAKPRAWTSGATLTYRWYANGQPISKATAPTFTPTAALKGKKISVTVTGAKAGYSTVSRASKVTKAVPR